ncbi:hypothetical protein D0865_07176 [Hortaea werneckii]|uniref:F-box domain-containing protein n=1 Tax=Hortaea werneckii TaxID=91943 RepID=A0A3M7CDD1_HORWE|nr:hypothetical protein D0865_07176 [Hortaea werneckii]
MIAPRGKQTSNVHDLRQASLNDSNIRTGAALSYAIACKAKHLDMKPNVIMGRHEYLSRLALGRSPFETIDRRNDGSSMQADDGESTEPEGSVQSMHGTQQYNSKGRPINPTTDLRNAEMRKAQNSVLELVGVVERRERSEHSSEMKFRYIHHARQTVLAAEHETGEGIESLIQLLIAPLTTWWSDCLIQRCLIGLYTAKAPFASIVSSMWQTLRTGGLKGTYSVLFPGLIPYVTYVIAQESIISSTDLTTFRRPSFGEPPDVPKTPTIKDPLGWILFQTYGLRRKVVEWCGWTVVPSAKAPSLDAKHEIDVLGGNGDGTDGSVRRHRSTALARLPAQHLAAHIDAFLERLVLLPLECIVLRAVAVSYSNSPLPKTLEALAATPTLPGPFGGWISQALHSHSTIASVSAQANNVGLALILRLTMGTLLCTGVAKGICWIARMNRVQDGLQREGKSSYRRGDYKTAIGHFDRAIGRAPSVQLLDNRAACYEKLNDLPAALKDAKRAIQFQNEDPTGYLRAGKVLVKMEKQSVALEIYAHGLKKVKHIGQGYELLRKVHGELITQLAPPTSVDPLTVLPRELAELILGYLSFQQRIAISRVSKQWSGFIRSSPNLWQHLDLSNPKRKVKTAFISKAINIARQKLTSATLSSLHDFDKVLHALLRHCPIEHLTLCDTGLQSQKLVEALKKNKHLKSLRLDRGTEIGPTTLAQVIQVCASTLETFQCTLARNEEFVGIWTKCEHLNTLKVTLTGDASRSRPGNAATNAPVAPGLGGALLPNLHEFTPNLQSLTIYDKKPRSQLHSVLDLRNLGSLERLDLELPIESAHQLMLPPTLVHLRLEQLLELGLRPSSVCDDNITDVITEKLPSLHTVDLSGTDITGVGVKKLLRNSNLKNLVVNDCRYLGSDAVAWAREYGVKVAYKMSSSETGGKKVRY